MPSLPPFRKYLLYSGLTHLLFVLILLTNRFFPFLEKPLFEEKVTWINLPLGLPDQPIPGPLKAEDLPKSTITEQKEVFKPPPTAAEIKTVKTVPVKTAPQKKESAKERARDSAIEKALAGVQTELKNRHEIQPEVGQVSEGQGGGVPFGSPEAKYVSQYDPEYLLYQAKIRDRIMKEWLVPVTLQETPLNCQVIVRINDRGEVTEMTLKKKSGSEPFDLSTLRAIQHASPLDIPPTRLQYEAVDEGFLIEFDNQKR